MTIKTSLLAAIAALAAGCATTDSDNLEAISEDVIGGVPAYSHALDAVGALGSSYDTDGDGRGDAYYPFCTGTLIAPTVVLTAEHCIGGDMTGVAFLIGASAYAPDRVVPALAAVAETTIVGGVQGLGSDVAIVHLAEPVLDVTPLVVAPFPADLIGQRFTVLGYGAQDNTERAGTRLAGALTLRGTSGRIFEHLFGSFPAFLDQGVPRLHGITPTEADREWLQAEYDATTVARRLRGDARRQPRRRQRLLRRLGWPADQEARRRAARGRGRVVGLRLDAAALRLRGRVRRAGPGLARLHRRPGGVPARLLRPALEVHAARDLDALARDPGAVG
jgi:hypothetical protein